MSEEFTTPPFELFERVKEFVEARTWHGEHFMLVPRPGVCLPTMRTDKWYRTVELYIFGNFRIAGIEFDDNEMPVGFDFHDPND